MFIKEPNEELHDDIKKIMILSKRINDKYKIDIFMGNDQYTLDSVNKFYINDIQLLQKKLSNFLYKYQKVIPFESNIMIGCFKPKRKYILKPTKFRIKKEKEFNNDIMYTKWIDEAIIFINENENIVLPKILEIYSYLNYRYNYQTTNNIKQLKLHQFKKYRDDGKFKNNNGDIVTLEQIITELVHFEYGIFNAPDSINHLGLYESSFYNKIMCKLLTNIVNELSHIYIR